MRSGLRRLAVVALQQAIASNSSQRKQACMRIAAVASKQNWKAKAAFWWGNSNSGPANNELSFGNAKVPRVIKPTADSPFDFSGWNDQAKNELYPQLHGQVTSDLNTAKLPQTEQSQGVFVPPTPGSSPGRFDLTNMSPAQRHALLLQLGNSMGLQPGEAPAFMQPSAPEVRPFEEIAGIADRLGWPIWKAMRPHELQRYMPEYAASQQETTPQPQMPSILENPSAPANGAMYSGEWGTLSDADLFTYGDKFTAEVARRREALRQQRQQQQQLEQTLERFNGYSPRNGRTAANIPNPFQPPSQRRATEAANNLANRVPTPVPKPLSPPTPAQPPIPAPAAPQAPLTGGTPAPAPPQPPAPLKGDNPPR